MTKKNPTILLGVSGGIAAVKAPELVRLFTDKGATVRVVMTSEASRFVTPLSLGALSGAPVLSSIFEENAHAMPHLRLAREADLMVIAPATAAIMGSMATGTSSDLVTLCYLTTTAPTLIAPAMHDTMWLHPAVQDNAALLKKRGVTLVGPVKGKLADNTVADGRMAEPADIVSESQKLLSK